MEKKKIQVAYTCNKRKVYYNNTRLLGNIGVAPIHIDNFKVKTTKFLIRSTVHIHGEMTDEALL